MPQPIPYLAFNGNCADAKLEMLTYGQSPMAAQSPPAVANLIMHARLAISGKVTMPFGPTFWAKRFGMVTDKFGCPWIVNGEMIDVAIGS